VIAPSLYADLTARGVRLSVAPTPRDGDLSPLRLRVRAPDGALTPGLKEAIERHRDDLLDFVFELEERAALHLERAGANSAELESAAAFARSCVRGGGALPERSLLDLALNHPTVQAAVHAFARVGFEVIDVRRREAAA
jgi:hypothetical protein